MKRSSRGYPFEGYYDILNDVYNSIDFKKGSKILDIGVGTGMVTRQLYKDGAIITGIDFSEKMLSIAAENMPCATFINFDFNCGLPDEILNKKYDYIISSYAFHHLLADRRIVFIKSLLKILKPHGKIIIADVAFRTSEDMEDCMKESGDSWDHDEIYVIGDNLLETLKKEGIDSSYKQVSTCGGILEIISRHGDKKL